MDKEETSSSPVLSGTCLLRRSESQLQKEKEVFLKQLHAFPDSFQIQDKLPDDKELPLSGLVWAIFVGYRSGRTASLEEARARNMAAFLLHVLGRSEEALHELDAVLKLEGQGKNLVTLANKAVILWEQHNWSQAQQQLRTLKAIQDDPDCDFEYLVVRAEAELAFTYSRLGPDFYSRSLELFRKVLPQAREPELMLWKFGHALIWQRILRANPDSSLFKPPASMIQTQRELLIELLEIANTCPCRNTKAKAFAELALLMNMVWKVYHTRREFADRARLPRETCREKCCEKALSLDRQDHSVLVKCGRILRYTRRPEESRELLEKAVSMKPSSTGYHHLGLTYKAFANHAIHKHKNHAPGYYQLMEDLHSPRGAGHSSDRSDYKDAVRELGQLSLVVNKATGEEATGYSGSLPRGQDDKDAVRQCDKLSKATGYSGSLPRDRGSHGLEDGRSTGDEATGYSGSLSRGQDDKDAVRQCGKLSLVDDKSTGEKATGYSGSLPRDRGVRGLEDGRSTGDEATGGSLPRDQGFRGGNRPVKNTEREGGGLPKAAAGLSGYRGRRNYRPDRLQTPDPRALGINPELPSLSLDRDIRKMQRMIKSPPIQGVTNFSRDGEFVMEAMQCFELAVDISKGQNTRAMYDLALLHRCLGEYEQAKIYLKKMLKYQHNFFPVDQIHVCEQLGLVIKELSKTENDSQTAKEMRNNSKHWLLTALKAASELYAKSLHKQIGEIWRSFSSLLQEMKACDEDATNNLKKSMEKAELFRLIHDHEESLAVLRHFEQLSPEDKDDPEVLAEYIKNFAGMHEYQQVLTYLNLLKGTTQRERVNELLGEDYERQINIKAGRQALLSAPADDSPYSTPSLSKTFKKAFDDVYNAESSEPDTASSEGGNGASPEQAASAFSSIRPVRKQWDVVVLHEEESSEKADSLVRVLRDLCELRATALHSEVKPGMSELKFTKMMEQSQMVLVLVETDDHNDEVLRLFTELAALYQSTVILFTDGAENKIPDVLKSHRKFLCPDRLLHFDSLDPSEACTEETADFVCELMCFLTSTKNLK